LQDKPKQFHEPSAGFVKGQLGVTEEELTYFNQWFYLIVENLDICPGTDWRNIMRDVRGNLLAAFLKRFRGNPAMQIMLDTRMKED